VAIADVSTLKISIVVGRTRARCFGLTAARWIEVRARSRPELDVQIVDLADVGLPSTYPSDPAPTAPLLERLVPSDGFIVVTAEHNSSYPAALKQAIDLAHSVWRAKPVAFVSYGGVSGGLQAVEQLRVVFAELDAVGLRDTVSFRDPEDELTGEDDLTDRADPATRILLDQLTWWGDALRRARHGAVT
jgi:NAD(P)H-dependent FMN reductase